MEPGNGAGLMDGSAVGRYVSGGKGEQIDELSSVVMKKVGASPERSMRARHTAQIKRAKFEKLAYESKPLTVYNYPQHLFAIQSVTAEKVPNMQVRVSNSSKMMPATNSLWVSNTKKLQRRWFNNKRGVSVDECELKRRVQYRQQSVDVNDSLMRDVKEYFLSMRYYLKNQKKRIEQERKLRMFKSKVNVQHRDNLNIIQLKPQSHNSSRKHTINDSICNFSKSQLPITVIEYQSSVNLQKMTPERSEMLTLKSSVVASPHKPYEQRILRKKVNRKQQFHNIFGVAKESMKQEDVQQLRYMYYRDFLWKISFNRGFVYELPGEVFRYFVGKGNNSRLVRNIMGRRPWWVEEARPENAHFIWTQLKLYDVYKSQKRLMGEDHFITGLAMEKSMELNPEKAGVEMEQRASCLSEDKNLFILNRVKYESWRAYIKGKGGVERKPFEDMKQRGFVKLQRIKTVHKMTNHLQFSRVIGNKKALYRTMEAYFDYRSMEGYLPLTFHITGGLEDEEYLRFLREFYKRSKEGYNWWIVKPGELSNRGRDIKYCENLNEVKEQIKQKKTNSNGSPRTYIVQSYLEKPFLYQGRKFDLRHYLMITSTEGKIRGYFYQQGYVRTTSFPYSLASHQPGVHLTNDAVQKYLPQYGKFEKANKLSYEQLNQFMLKQNPKKGFYDVVLPQLRSIGKDIIHAAFPFIDPERRANNFEIFGIDVMIDSDYKCWLIEVNTNPCIEVNCGVLSAIIPHMLQNAFAIALDSIIAPAGVRPKVSPGNYVQENKFQLVFDEQIEGGELLRNYRENNIDIGKYGDDDDNYESCDEEDFDG